MFDPLLGALQNIGLGVAANAAYDALKRYATGNSNPTVQGAAAALQNVLNMNGVQVNAATIIEMLAQRGVITISNSHLYGHTGVVMGAQGGHFTFGNNSVSQTANTAITAGHGATITATGNARIVQHPDGSIRFYT